MCTHRYTHAYVKHCVKVCTRAAGHNGNHNAKQRQCTRERIVPGSDVYVCVRVNQICACAYVQLFIYHENQNKTCWNNLRYASHHMSILAQIVRMLVDHVDEPIRIPAYFFCTFFDIPNTKDRAHKTFPVEAKHTGKSPAPMKYSTNERYASKAV